VTDTTELIQSEGDRIRLFLAMLDGAARYAAASVSWMSRAACQQEDPEIFFPIAAQGPALAEISAAKAVCGRCAVRATCLSYGMETRQTGIWGGTTWEERRAMQESSGRSAREQGGRKADPARRHRPGQQSGRPPDAEFAMSRGAIAAPEPASAPAEPVSPMPVSGRAREAAPTRLPGSSRPG
jgi:WhiB family transcriptional regulator, redox-sensing transcriptional regulator